MAGDAADNNSTEDGSILSDRQPEPQINSEVPSLEEEKKQAVPQEAYTTKHQEGVEQEDQEEEEEEFAFPDYDDEV